MVKVPSSSSSDQFRSSLTLATRQSRGGRKNKEITTTYPPSLRKIYDIFYRKKGKEKKVGGLQVREDFSRRLKCIFFCQLSGKSITTFLGCTADYAAELCLARHLGSLLNSLKTGWLILLGWLVGCFCRGINSGSSTSNLKTDFI